MCSGGLSGKDSGVLLAPRATLLLPLLPREEKPPEPVLGLDVGCGDRDKPSVFTSGDTLPDVGEKDEQQAKSSAAAVEKNNMDHF